MKSIVGLDLETTSLDAETGEIIEIAAIRYNWKSGQEIERLECLNQSRNPLPPIVTDLTGITDEMLSNQPYFSDIASDVAAFIGSDVIFAHNASFDVKWLRKNNVQLADSQVWDTFLLSHVAWPEASSYNLGTLAAHLNIVNTVEHRAAADVTLTWQLLNAIIEELYIPSELLNKVEALLTKCHYDHYLPIFSEKKGEVIDKTKAKVQERVISTGNVNSTQDKDISSLINKGGVAVMEIYTDHKTAPPFLKQTILNATALNRTAISVSSRYYQDKLASTYAPQTQRSLGTRKTISSIDSRSNYLCPVELRHLLAADISYSSHDVFALLTLLVWHAKGGYLLHRLNWSHMESDMVARSAANGAICRTACSLNTSCPYYEAHEAAKRADVIITTHDYLIDMYLQSEEPLDAKTIIIEEAFNMPTDTQRKSGLDLSHQRITKSLPYLLANRAPHESQKLIKKHAKSTLTAFENLLQECGHFLQRATSQNMLRVTPSLRKDVRWKRVNKAHCSLAAELKTLIGFLESITDKVSEPNRSSFIAATTDLKALSIQLNEFIAGVHGRLQVIEIIHDSSNNLEVRLSDALADPAIAISSMIELYKCVIFTDAVLSYNKSFAYIKRRLGVTHAQEYSYNHELSESKLHLFLVDNLPNPSEISFNQNVADALVQIVIGSKRRALGLITSNFAIREIHSEIINKLSSHATMSDSGLDKRRIGLFAQGVTGGRENVSQRFRNSDLAILLGTDKMWLDAGSLVSSGSKSAIVVIPKLPFSPPHDPAQEAYASDANLDKFNDIQVPEMIMKISRVVSQLDRSGIGDSTLVILDPRIHRTSYGHMLVESIPALEKVTCNINDIGTSLL